MRVTFLGTGTSRGVPVIGCPCGTCVSTDPRNHRLRSSILVEADVAVVVDASVDFRQQMLRHKVNHLDAVVLTHHHADHVLGLDDVLPFNFLTGRALPLYGSSQTLDEVKMTLRHLFLKSPLPRVVQLDPQVIDRRFKIGELHFEPIPVFHGALPILGFRIGSFAYVTDTSEIPETSLKQLEGVETLVLGALRYKKHPTHFSVSEAIEVAARLRPKQTFFTHMCHDVEQEEACSQLPEGVTLAYDGLVLEI